MKIKLKSIMASILCVVTLLSLAACGGDKPVSTPDANTPSSTSTPNSTPVSTPEVKDEEPEQAEEISFESLGLHTDFSQGAAWIGYRETGDKSSSYGIINTEGEIIRVAEFPMMTAGSYLSDFSGGYSYFNYSNNEKRINCFTIYDSMGNITAQSSDDFTHRILSGGGGYYLVQKDYQTMTANELHYGVMDAHGNWIYEPTVDFLPGKGYYSGTYLGDGYFYCYAYPPEGGPRRNVLLDAKKTSSPIIEVLSEDSQFEALGLYEGSIILYENSDYTSDDPIIHRFDADGTTTVIGTGNAAIYSRNGINYRGDYYVKFAEGVIFTGGEYADDITGAGGGTGQFIDMYGNIIADYTDYKLIFNFGDGIWERLYEFVGGYAAVLIRGVDDAPYLEIIDKTGTCAFEPIRLDSVGVEKIFAGKVGCRIDGKRVWVDAQGNITDHPDANFNSSSNNTGYTVKDNQIINMDGEALSLSWAK